MKVPGGLYQIGYISGEAVGTLLYWLPGRGRGWPILVPVALFAALVFQFGAGYNRELALHIPLGVGIVATSVLFAVWTWCPAARRARRPLRRTR